MIKHGITSNTSMATLDQSIPRHQQIADHLRKEINEQEFKPGDKLPSEKRLCDYFKVSRITVREALKSLENEGLIFKKQGLGAFVREEPKQANLVQLTDFSEDMRRAGHSSSSKLISFKKVKADVSINTFLGIAPDKSLIKIERVRIADGIPVAFDVTWMPASYGQLLMDEDLAHKTIYEILEEEYSIPIIGGRYTFTAAVADEHIAKHLDVPVGSPLFEIDRCSKTTGDKKIYFQRRFNNPNHIQYEIELVRQEGDESSYRSGMPLKEFCPKFKF